MFRHRYSIGAGRVHDRNPGFGGGIQINVVHAHSGAANHAQPARIAQHRGIHINRRTDDQRVSVRQRSGQIAVKLFVRDDHPARLVLEHLHRIRGDFFCNNNFHDETIIKSWIEIGIKCDHENG